MAAKKAAPSGRAPEGAATPAKARPAQARPAQARADEEPGILHAEAALSEDERDSALRPHTLQDFVGQAAIKENLAVYIEAARSRGDSLDHVFLTGPPGLGKTTLAQIVARELGVDFRQTSAPVLEKPKDLAGILTNLSARSVFFIDEIHRLKPAIEEMLYIAMEDYEMDWIVGQGPAARTLRIPIQPFTLVGATTRAGSVAAPLISRFGIPFRLSLYEAADMEAIIRRSAALLNVRVEGDAASLLARCARGTPRVANRLLRRMIDFAQVLGSGPVTVETAQEGLRRLEIDCMGLERLDRDILRMIIERYAGGPVGAETLAISIGESVDTLEDYYEPYLIQAGFLQRSPRGRMVTDLAYRHLNLERSRAAAEGLFG
ncbi:MAG: Holliday junction branch migration DNA helicase RuvB [Treponema sp.]|jgi:Holliday junction DNA helicase RuvB|nr:Holliday junction branch migration DNA helicase RuvB [Treponema sp.]